MLNKTIKTTVGIFAVSLFLSACSSTSTTDSASTTTTQETKPTTTAVSSGSANGSVNQGVVAPTQTVFYFDFDSSVLRPESQALLDAHAAALKAKPRAFRLEGHADERGTREYNIALGERRAQAVKAYLQAQGVTAPVEVVSYGEERPEVDASNDYAWQQNRRVEIK